MSLEHPTIVEIAAYFGVTSVTISNYKKEAKRGNKEYARRLEAYYDYYQRTELKKEKNIRVLKDTEDGQTYYLLKE